MAPAVRARSRGFTLIELMITVVIMAILAGISVAGYGQYVRRANRVDATSALLRISTAQERFYLQSNTYAGNALLAEAPPDGLGMAGTEQGLYALAIEPDAAGLVVGYRATATAISTRGQGEDAACQVFSIDQSGKRSATAGGGAAGPEVTARCWR